MERGYKADTKSCKIGIWVGLTKEQMEKLSFICGVDDRHKTKMAGELLAEGLEKKYTEHLLKIKDHYGWK